MTVGAHATDPVLRTIHVLDKVMPGATQLPSGYDASPTNWPSHNLQTTNRHAHKYKRSIALILIAEYIDILFISLLTVSIITKSYRNTELIINGTILCLIFI